VTEEHLEYDSSDPDRANGEHSAGAPPKKAVNRLALARAISFSGGNAAFVALLVVLYQETDSSSVVALGAFASFAVPALASPFAGWLGDRFDRRKVMVASELLGAACFFLMAAFTSSPVELLVLRVVASLAAAPLMSATAAALPRIVGSPGQLPAANAKLAAAGISGGLVGPLVAAMLLLISGPASVFLFNTVTFLISAVLLMAIDADFRPHREDDEKGRIAEFAAGFRYLGQHQLLRPVTLAYGITFIGLGLATPAEVSLSEHFGAGSTGFAALCCLFALGGIAGARFASRGLLRITTGPTAILPAASGAFAVGFLMIGFAPAFIFALAGMGLAGAAYGIWMVAHENLVQRVTPDAIRSRVFAGSEAVCLAGVSIGTIGAGGLIAAFGAAGTFRVGAMGSILASVLLTVVAITVAKSSPKAGRRGRGFLVVPPPPASASVASPVVKSLPAQTVKQGTA
jgi:MFS family permease